MTLSDALDLLQHAFGLIGSWGALALIVWAIYKLTNSEAMNE